MENMMDIAQYNLIHVTDYIYIYIAHLIETNWNPNTGPGSSNRHRYLQRHVSDAYATVRG